MTKGIKGKIMTKGFQKGKVESLETHRSLIRRKYIVAREDKIRRGRGSGLLRKMGGKGINRSRI